MLGVAQLRQISLRLHQEYCIDAHSAMPPQVVDAKKASYGVDNALFAVTQLAQTTMRSDIAKISLDKTFEERDTLNRSIVEAIRSVMHTSFPASAGFINSPQKAAHGPYRSMEAALISPHPLTECQRHAVD